MASARKQFDVLVIGGGHAGAEAAWAAANLLRPSFDESGGDCGRVALVTMDPAKTGAMSCNPAIGGLAKGQMVREIDALGGLMGLAADATGIQFRVLNASKGAAVRGPRCQSDKYRYAAEVQRLLGTRPNLHTIRGTVDRLLVEDGRCIGVFCRGFEGDHGPACATDGCCGEFGDVGEIEKSFTLRSHATVLTTGTFMRALMHTGERKAEGGRVGEGSAVGISAELKRLGFELGRLKTGTPSRLAAESIDFAGLEEQPGDAEPVPFSEMTEPETFPALPQRVCWITHTNAAAHDAIRGNLERAPMYNGDIDADAGPRYCPSIEDKVVRFADRTSHHVFLEPESLDTNEIYCNGISTSLPTDVQDVIVRALPGCEHAEILRYGYAVEYDMVWPHQIDSTCMTKALPGLLLAGQINGTSGYEEAAGQGLVAGVNAVRWSRAAEHGGSVSSIRDRFDGFRLSRDQAYVGVMLDDLVTKTPREPYRMFTSRAEHRLLLRADNAADRLTPLGRELGLVDAARWEAFEQRRTELARLEEFMRSRDVGGTPMARWVTQPQVDAAALREQLKGGAEPRIRIGGSTDVDGPDVRLLQTFLADRQYAGYIDRQRREVARLAEQEHVPLPTELDYAAVKGLRTEAADTLSRFRPATLGQAGRLAGVNPADLMLVSIHLRQFTASG